MKKYLALMIIIFGLLLTNCEKEEIILQSSYPSLNGQYSYHEYKSWENGLYEISKFEAYYFDNTRIGDQSYCYWSYTPENGWENASKSITTWDIEWKVENGRFYERYYSENEEYCGDWRSYSFEFIDNTQFKIDGKLFELYESSF